MGNACCNEANNKDEHHKNYGGAPGMNKPAKVDPQLNELMQEAEKHQSEIARI